MLVPDPFARPEPAEFTLGEALERLSARHQAPFTAPTTRKIKSPVAACHAEEFHVTAFAKSLLGTRDTTSDDEAGPRKARAMPNTTRMPSIT